MLPGRDGYNVLQELRGPDYRSVPVIVVTARALDKRTLNGIKKESNVKGSLDKPLTPDVFKETLRRALEGKRPQKN